MKYLIAVTLLIATSLANARELPLFDIYTEHYEPYNFVDPNDGSGELQGIAVDLLADTLKRAGSEQTKSDFKLVPWARGYDMVQSSPNTILFSTTRTSEREDLFKWVCPIDKLKTQLIALKSANITINSEDQLTNHTIGTVREDVGEQLVLKAGVPKQELSRANNYSNNIRKLEAGRIDLYVGSMDNIAPICKTTGCDPSEFEPVHTLDVSELCYAFNKDTPDQAVTMLQQALDGLIEEGRPEELDKKYEEWR